MSFNITSDGSPTPRKGVSRFCRTAGDLKIDTSPELLGQAVGGFSQNHHHPFALYRAFGSSLTANMQGAKRPLGVSTLGNQHMMMQQQNAFDGYKVSHHRTRAPPGLANSTLVIAATSLPMLPSNPVEYGTITDCYRSPIWMAMTIRPLWTHCCNVSTVAHRRPISTPPQAAPCPSPRPPMSSRQRRRPLWKIRCSSSMLSSYTS
jgi:hypothetical protein